MAPKTAGAERTVGLIGCGLIGRGVLRSLDTGDVPGWKLGAVLATSARVVDDVEVSDDPAEFFAHSFDLIIESAGPQALTAHGPDALAVAEVWTVSGTALTSDGLVRRLTSVGEASGNRLRLLPGAIAALDGVSAISVADDARVHIFVDLVPAGDVDEVVFEGSVRDGAAAFPNHVNVAVAAALAGLGLDKTALTVRQPPAGQPHTLRIETSSRDGRVEATTFPIVSPPDDIHIVTASILAALKARNETIWVG